MNVALVVLDTLRYDAFQRHFDWLSGIRFENMWSTGRWTVPVHASLFTGKYPSEIGVHAGNTTLDCSEPTLAETLSEADHTTRGFSNNVNITAPFAFDRGFDFFDGGWRVQNLDTDTFDWETFVTETRNRGPRRYLTGLRRCVTEDCATWPSIKRGALLKLRDLGISEQPDDDGASETLEFVRETTFGSDEFLFVNLMEAHWPYEPPQSYRRSDSDSLQDGDSYNGLAATLGEGPPIDSAILERAYDDSVRYLADVYEEIFSVLREDFDYIVTLSDHGEMFGEHGVWQHAYGVHPALTHVPCIISGEGVPDQQCAAPTSLLDVHQTILTLMEEDAPSDGRVLPTESVGEWVAKQSDSTTDESYACFAEHHGINRRSAARVAANGGDPSEADHELAGVATASGYGYETPDGLSMAEIVSERDGEHTASMEKFRNRLATHRKRIQRRTVEETATTSSVIQQRLESLGYA
ncbi:sulfatase [Halococcus morrhuae DSM 1307]|uniref:Sulfatase n=1 Tax=Halococcus morrhuae DSM 1307 TaxID=931277 RepID=M0MH79_HALMO|nr:sulfatase-like hydrolase/transferase [Halococcus morrhuae]EMA43790.1 sulfatase [Halococcus morrhuae DSM 1307]